MNEQKAEWKQWTKEEVRQHTQDNYPEYYRHLTTRKNYYGLLRIVGYDPQKQERYVSNYSRKILEKVFAKCIDTIPESSKTREIDLESYIKRATLNEIVTEIRKYKIVTLALEPVDEQGIDGELIERLEEDDESETVESDEDIPQYVFEESGLTNTTPIKDITRELRIIEFRESCDRFYTVNDPKAGFAIAALIAFKLRKIKSSGIKLSNSDFASLMMWYADDLSQKEIAERTGRSKSNMSHIKKKFTKLLGALTDEQIIQFREEYEYGLQQLHRYLSDLDSAEIEAGRVSED